MNMRFFNPRHMIEHRHIFCVSTHHIPRPTPDGKWPTTLGQTWSEPEYEILISTDQWGYYPVMGSGRVIAAEIPESQKRRVSLLTQRERDEFLKTYFPYTWEYEEEQRNNSLSSATL